jgi:hypothetical protein
MSSNSEKSAALAGMMQDHTTRRTAAIAAELAAVPAATADHHTMPTGDLFSEVFARPTVTKHWGNRGAVPAESPWTDALRLAATDDDAPHPPESAPASAEPAPAPPPAETRVRADDLFQQMESRLQATVEITDLPADVQLRRAYRELPGGQREAIAKLIEAQDFGLAGYFDSRNFGADYVAVLVGSALARRFADAQRLQPDLSPAQLLEQISAAATAGG